MSLNTPVFSFSSLLACRTRQSCVETVSEKRKKKKKEKKKEDTRRTLESGKSYPFRCPTHVRHRHDAKNGVSVQPRIRIHSWIQVCYSFWVYQYKSISCNLLKFLYCLYCSNSKKIESLERLLRFFLFACFLSKNSFRETTGDALKRCRLQELKLMSKFENQSTKSIF